MTDYTTVKDLTRCLILQFKEALLTARNITVWNRRGRGRGKMRVSHKSKSSFTILA